MINGRIDLHMHSTVSDGTDTPEELLRRVREEGITIFSVTDHDAIKSAQLIPQRLSEGDPRFISGVEFSCRDEEGRYHILGYRYNPLSDAMKEIVGKGHRIRMEKAQARMALLGEEFGFSFSKEDTEALLSLNNPGKPHIGNLMVQYGYAVTKDEAIDRYINKLHYRSKTVRPEEAIDAILSAGGIPVLAHPSFGDGSQLIVGDEMEKRVRKLVEMGLKGIEVFYSGFSKELREEALSFAEKFDLYVTAGSDYHGKNKSIPLGKTGLSPEDALPEGLVRFLEDTQY